MADPNDQTIGGARSGGEEAGTLAGPATLGGLSFSTRAGQAPAAGAAGESVASSKDVKRSTMSSKSAWS